MFCGIYSTLNMYVRKAVCAALKWTMEHGRLGGWHGVADDAQSLGQQVVGPGAEVVDKTQRLASMGEQAVAAAAAYGAQRLAAQIGYGRRVVDLHLGKRTAGQMLRQSQLVAWGELAPLDGAHCRAAVNEVEVLDRKSVV